MSIWSMFVYNITLNKNATPRRPPAGLPLTEDKPNNTLYYYDCICCNLNCLSYVYMGNNTFKLETFFSICSL